MGKKSYLIILISLVLIASLTISLAKEMGKTPIKMPELGSNSPGEPSNSSPNIESVPEDTPNPNINITFDTNSSVNFCSEDNSSCPDNPNDYIGSDPGDDGSSNGKNSPTQETTTTSSSGGGCLTSWTCTEWTACESGAQTRTCSKTTEYCYANPEEKPLEAQSCVSQTENTISTQPGFVSRITGAVVGLNQRTKGFAGVVLFFATIAGVYAITVTLRSRIAKANSKK